ncbi:MAG TPA: DUF2589 domain-containing protein [Archangium sp.]|nr:DUF2589 domain-containing protein [Archangium sp.]
MAGPIGLHHLVEAIASSVIEAQDELEQYQLASLRRYFDEDSRPKQVSMLVPSLSHGDDKDINIRVPWLALIRPNQLAIKDIQIDMEVGLLEFDPHAARAPGETQDSVELPALEGSGTLQVDVASLSRNDKRNSAKIVLRVEGHEPSDGLARMVHELVKRIRAEE